MNNKKVTIDLCDSVSLGKDTDCLSKIIDFFLKNTFYKSKLLEACADAIGHQARFVAAGSIENVVFKCSLLIGNKDCSINLRDTCAYCAFELLRVKKLKIGMNNAK